MDEIFGSLVKLGYRVWSKFKDVLNVAVENGTSAIQTVLSLVNQGLTNWVQAASLKSPSFEQNACWIESFEST